MAYIINPAASTVEIRTYLLTQAEIFTLGSNPFVLSDKENWFPFFYGFECENFTTFYDFTDTLVINDRGPASYFKCNKTLQSLQGIGFTTAIYGNSGIFLATAGYLNDPPSFVLTTDSAGDPTVGNGDFTIKIAGLLL
jgi:hypothetical protein